MAYNPNIYNRRSVRLKGYDYSREGLYFFTICCDKRFCSFGGISEGELILNETGKFAKQCWMEIPNHFPYAVLHEYIVMPNHVHGIIELKSDMNIGVYGVDDAVGRVGPDGHVVQVGPVGAENFLPLRSQMNLPNQQTIPPQHQFQKMIPRSIGSLSRDLKLGLQNGLGKIPILTPFGNAIIMNILSGMKNHIITSPDI